VIASNARFDATAADSRVVTGELRLRGAVISGGLRLDDARLVNSGAYALDGERLQMSATCWRPGARSSASYTLSACRSRAGWRSTTPGCWRPTHRGVPVSRGSRCVYGRRASVEARSACGTPRSGRGRAERRPAAQPGRVALRLSRASAGGVFLGSGFHASGEVRMHLAQIGHGLTLAGATLHAPGRVALDLDGIRVEGDVDAQAWSSTARCRCAAR